MMINAIQMSYFYARDM
uniref:Uncharacterized protein n=1 Tax=Arundo donax TaxID=35708 RepID=A0A0A9BV82_ARUDO